MHKNITIIAVVIGVVVLALVGYAFWLGTHSATQTPTQTQSSIEYSNSQYGFKVTLPQDWKGYSTITGTWSGNTVASNGEVQTNAVQGPMISLRNPLWTQAKPYQDIPVMIFTVQQWNDLQQDKFHIGAAPINPSELGRNSVYVFALPARYNFAFPAGYQEVDQIIQGKPLQTFEPSSASNTPSTAAGQHCGGNIANPAQCPAGYHCAPDPKSHLLFGDVGGICVAN